MGLWYDETFDEHTRLGLRVKETLFSGQSAYQKVEVIDKQIKNNNLALMKYQRPAKVTYHWSREVPLVARAMVLADEVLFAAGPPMDPADAGVNEPTFDAGGPALLMAFRADDGGDLAQAKLDAQPVFDGLIAAGGKLYLALTNGTVLCLGPGR